MNLTQSATRLLATAVLSMFVLVGCGGGGDIEISADDNSVVNDNSTTNGGGGSSNPCANYTDQASNTLIQGTFDGQNCTYGPDFVGDNNPLTVDLTIPFISGVHIFEDTLQVGENTASGAAPACGPDPAVDDCDGPTLTVRAGNTLAWTQSSDYLLINRGSRILAEGSPSAPITLTGFLDAVQGTAGPEAVQLWGGVVFNGNGISNKCTDTQRANDTCHILSEGRPSNYGGDDNTESSGILRYVVVKHTGFEVAPGDELNGITFNGIGAGTVVENVEIYSTFDDGVEFFGGAVQLTNLVTIFIKDDSIDYADGWVGGVDHALVIHSSTDGNRCIEADGQDPDFGATPTTNPTITHMTCIISGNDGGTHGDSEGILLRRGVASNIQDSIVTDALAIDNLSITSGNECLELNDDETFTLASGGTSVQASVLLACTEATKGCRTFDASGDNCTDENFANGDTVGQWFLDNGTGSYPGNVENVVVVTGAGGGGAAVIMDGIFTASQLVDDAGTDFDVTTQSGDPVGAVTRSDDWTANWTFGFDNLWFVARP